MAGIAWATISMPTTMLALDANTGKRLWHFQGVHHDIWDRDFPSQPALFTMKREGKTVEALAQTTKQGYLYLFDRVTGKPLFPIHERPYPASTVPGEVTAKTQPHAGAAGAVCPAAADGGDADHAHAGGACVGGEGISRRCAATASSCRLSPVGKQTIVFPGFDGGAEWGGPAVDPVDDMLYVNANEMAWLGGLIQNPGGSTGGADLQYQCAMCHGVTGQVRRRRFHRWLILGRSSPTSRLRTP